MMLTSPISRALLVLSLAILVVLLLASVVGFELPPRDLSWEAGAAVAFVASLLPWWP
jgi:membrane protease YdiL (CAAX protease family)